MNHFQGRVSCPYGQDTTGKAIAPATSACALPGVGGKVTGLVDSSGAASTPRSGFAVKPQCTDRTTDKTVYCSCRCADINGTQSGGNFCNCPSGFACTQLVSSLSSGTDQGLTGAYCIKNGTAFSATASATGASACTTCGGAGGKNCGNLNNTGGT